MHQRINTGRVTAKEVKEKQGKLDVKNVQKKTQKYLKKELTVMSGTKRQYRISN